MFNFEYFINLGLNLYTSSHVKNVFNIHETNTLKSPNIYWENYKYEKQDINDITFLKEQQSCGFGIILGFNDIYSLDIDGYLDETIIYNLLYILELPSDYEWVIKSGSGLGFHIIFSCTNLKDLENKTLAYFARYENRDFAKLEFKFQGHSILPNSLHETGNYYSFYNKMPENSPKQVTYENLDLILKHYCSLQTTLSELGHDERGTTYHKINYVAPKDIESDFILTHTLRDNKFLIIEGDAKEIRTRFYSEEYMYMVQLSLLILDANYNIVFRKTFNYVDDINIFPESGDDISLDKANKLISGTKYDTLLLVSSYIEIVNNLVVFNEEFWSALQSEMELVLESNIRYPNRASKYRFFDRKSGLNLCTLSNSSDTELDSIFKKNFNKRTNLNSALLKAYSLYYLFLAKENIACESKRITPNELWEMRVLQNSIRGKSESIFFNNYESAKSYLSQNYGYSRGSIIDFIEESEFYINGDFENWISVFEFIVKEVKQNSSDSYDEIEIYGQMQEERRDMERDSFDALTDGQYGDFDDFDGDFGSLRDSLGF